VAGPGVGVSCCKKRPGRNHRRGENPRGDKSISRGVWTQKALFSPSHIFIYLVIPWDGAISDLAIQRQKSDLNIWRRGLARPRRSGFHLILRYTPS
jgi:hypothetical protein